MAPRRLALWGLVSTCLAIATVVHAFRKRPNFYAAAVYLAKSNACMLILWNQGIFQTVLLGKALQAVFLGELRLIEVERLQERGWFAVTETLLALTIFKNDFESTFVLLFVGLLFLKVFHWLASDRIEMMEQAAQVSRLAHARMLGLLSLLWLADIGCLLFAVESIMIDGPTVMIMFASEYLILLANVWTLSAKYVINCIDMRTEAPWEEKSIYVFYVELAADFFKLCTYLTFFGLILTFYGLPLNILRDVYITLRSFILKVRDLRRYRQATRNMDELYPNATREEMDGMADKTCIICREDMEWRAARGEHDAGAGGAEGAGPAEPQAPGPAAPRTGPNDTPKKLPCGHVFHFHCLRSWLERQQSCPTCRRPVLPNEQPQAVPLAAAGARAGNGGPPGPAVPGANGAGPTTPAPAGAVEAENAAIRQAQVNLARNLGREAFTSLFPGIPFPPEAEDVQPAVRTPRIASLEGTDVDPAQIDARPAPTQPPISSSGPIASTSGAATAAAADADNPLARFSLPSLPVPAGGEASLYQAPPTFSYPTIGTPASSFADLAYGAYPRFNGPRPTAFGATPSRTSPPNLIERIESVRTRWETRNNGQPDAAVGGDASGLSGSAPNVPTATAVPDEPSETRPPTTEEKGKGKAIENVEDVEASSTETVSPREAALRAAERRLGTGVTGSSTATKDAVDSDDLDSRMPEAKGKAWDPDDVAASAPPPRLIPLFDPSDPASVSAAALRCSSDEAQTAVWSHVDLEGAVSEAMQGKMRQLASFQARIDRLIEEMRVTLGGNP